MKLVIAIGSKQALELFHDTLKFAVSDIQENLMDTDDLHIAMHARRGNNPPAYCLVQMEHECSKEIAEWRRHFPGSVKLFVDRLDVGDYLYFIKSKVL